MDIVLAKRPWPDLIMHPHPLSDEKPSCSLSWLIMRTDKDSADVAFGSVDLFIGAKSDLYVIQNLEPKSSTKPWGQPPLASRVDSS